MILMAALIAGCGPTAEQLVGEAGLAMEAKDWAGASKTLERALSRDPTLAEAYRALAVSRIALGDRDAAAEALDGLLRLRPEDCRAHLLLAQYAAEQERWDDAVSHVVSARRFAEYRDDIVATQHLLNSIRSVIASKTAEASATILTPTGETP